MGKRGMRSIFRAPGKRFWKRYTMSTSEETLLGCMVLTQKAVTYPEQRTQLYTDIFTQRFQDGDYQGRVSGCIAQVLTRYLTPYRNGVLLIAGVGNAYSSMDSFGPSTVHRLSVRGLEQALCVQGLFSRTAAIVPGVRGMTNLTTSEYIAAIAGRIGADCVLLLDSCVSSSRRDLFSTVRICTGGIKPLLAGADLLFTAETLGVPVVCMTLPTAYLPEEAVNLKTALTVPDTGDAMERASIVSAVAIGKCLYPQKEKLIEWIIRTV